MYFSFPNKYYIPCLCRPTLSDHRNNEMKSRPTSEDDRHCVIFSTSFLTSSVPNPNTFFQYFVKTPLMYIFGVKIHVLYSCAPVNFIQGDSPKSL